ncbi:uncharacterized protein SCHCODRAFT_02183499 [Schizophyllum commune H4-8]|uniref:uncharacterized protein n=1 Tax=Schizophyllum commune (strain H4-8 / FGSC 9210) TaxID=578458 RepID=UPI002160FFF4|nr:uncharacterized protein SCHCODRAFT_02183499 [Schizophyllum commune H4-8]KAI5896101.1 hypothetical protein SCHCODRAFT_02183499 [Schizophyllum commune H4-8]
MVQRTEGVRRTCGRRERPIPWADAPARLRCVILTQKHLGWRVGGFRDVGSFASQAADVAGASGPRGASRSRTGSQAVLVPPSIPRAWRAIRDPCYPRLVRSHFLCSISTTSRLFLCRWVLLEHDLSGLHPAFVNLVPTFIAETSLGKGRTRR